MCSTFSFFFFGEGGGAAKGLYEIGSVILSSFVDEPRIPVTGIRLEYIEHLSLRSAIASSCLPGEKGS